NGRYPTDRLGYAVVDTISAPDRRSMCPRTTSAPPRPNRHLARRCRRSQTPALSTGPLAGRPVASATPVDSGCRRTGTADTAVSAEVSHRGAAGFVANSTQALATALTILRV